MFAPVVEGKCQFEKQCSGFCVCFFPHQKDFVVKKHSVIVFAEQLFNFFTLGSLIFAFLPLFLI